MSTDNDDLVAGAAVGQAGIAAAAAEPTAAKAKPAAKRAIAAKAKEVKIELSDDDVDRIADALVDKMSDRGAFDPPPEPVTAPAGAPPPAGVAPETVPQPPRKVSWAEKFRGGS